MITQKELKELLHYDLDTGIFTWRVTRSPNGKANAGSVAGNLNHDGRIRIKIFKKLYLAHRLAFLYVNGEFPEDEVDHRNRKPSDNRWVNLRKCSRIENTYNCGTKNTSKSGIKGVHWHKASNKWQAEINANGKQYYLGVFEDIELAEFVVSEARDILHGEFANNG